MGSAVKSSPELEFIFKLLQNGEIPDLAPDINKKDLFRLLSFHSLISPAYRALSRNEKFSEAKLLTELKNRSFSIAKRNLLLLAGQHEICSAFDQKGIALVFLKGIVLAEQLYEDISLRSTIDIDILVRPEDIKRAESILSGLGYDKIIPGKDLTDQQWDYYIRHRKDSSYNHRQKRITVEMHWGLISIKSLMRDMPAFLWKKTGFVSFKSGDLPALDQKNTFIYLCLHGIFHQYFRLFWLYDINAMLHQWKELDFEEILEKSKDLGIDRCIVSSCVLANQIFDGPVPPVIQDQYQNDRVNRKIVRDCRKAIMKSAYPESSGGFRRTLYFMRLRKDFSHKIYCITSIFIRKYIKWRFQ